MLLCACEELLFTQRHWMLRFSWRYKCFKGRFWPLYLDGPALHEDVEIWKHSETSSGSRPFIYRTLTVFFSSYDGFQKTALKREFCIRTISYVYNASSVRKIVNHTHGTLSVTWDCLQSFVIVLRKRVLLKSSFLLLDRYTLPFSLVSIIISRKYIWYENLLQSHRATYITRKLQARLWIQRDTCGNITSCIYTFACISGYESVVVRRWDSFFHLAQFTRSR